MVEHFESKNIDTEGFKNRMRSKSKTKRLKQILAE